MEQTAIKTVRERKQYVLRLFSAVIWKMVKYALVIAAVYGAYHAFMSWK